MITSDLGCSFSRHLAGAYFNGRLRATDRLGRTFFFTVSSRVDSYNANFHH